MNCQGALGVLGRLRLHQSFTRVGIEKEVPSGECVPESPTNPGYVTRTFPGPDCTSWKEGCCTPSSARNRPQVVQLPISHMQTPGSFTVSKLSSIVVNHCKMRAATRFLRYL